jgi:hypothetical protein
MCAWEVQRPVVPVTPVTCVMQAWSVTPVARPWCGSAGSGPAGCPWTGTHRRGYGDTHGAGNGKAGVRFAWIVFGGNVCGRRDWSV